MTFYAQGPSDAHISLTTDRGKKGKYEIVIGVDGNRYSAIRKLNESSNYYDQNVALSSMLVLDDERLTGFWIQVFRNGTFNTGKLGDSIPLMTWTDPSPITINYFSFACWNNKVVKWLFNCYPNPDSDKTDNQTVADPGVVQGRREFLFLDKTVNQTTFLTPIERLRKDILKNGSHFSNRPSTDEKTETLDVTITFDFQYIYLDVMTSKLNIIGFATLEWTNSRLSWDPKAYHNISKLHFSHSELRRPELVLQNSFAPSVNIFSKAKILVNSNGKIIWRPAFRVLTTCNIDLRFWPWDVQHCTIPLSTRSQNTLNVHYEANQNYKTACPNVVHSGWKITQFRSSYMEENTPRNDDMNCALDVNTNNISLQLEIELSRNANSLRKLFHTPLILISSVWLSSFFVWSKSNLKFKIIFMSIIILTFVIVTIGIYVPVEVQDPPILFEGYLNMVLIISIDAFTSSIFIALRNHKKTKTELPSFKLMRFLTTPFVAKLFLLPKLESLGVYSELPDAEQPTTMWDIVFAAAQRILFLFYFTITALILTLY
ncbi:acetylcholine receptor subunit beta-like [Adelges cooleyi]|uniref:acetylcholine receptor subunit beta-like n=1 Tax=Adelges cooleyi TaxID=133065 RepID=UPI00217FAE32|nr:acetylcholine receptor subunit beta-like [Adelges cooleyi]